MILLNIFVDFDYALMKCLVLFSFQLFWIIDLEIYIVNFNSVQMYSAIHHDVELLPMLPFHLRGKYFFVPYMCSVKLV